MFGRDGSKGLFFPSTREKNELLFNAEKRKGKKLTPLHLTEHSAISEPRYVPIPVSKLHKFRRATNLEALK